MESSSRKRGSAFLSYARDDDQRPLEKPKTRGFVTYLYDQLKWELIDLGLPENLIWRDQENIRFSDNWPTVIDDTLNHSDIMLVVTSKNFANSNECKREVDLFVRRLRTLPNAGQRNRIFRVEKQAISDNELPEPLKAVHAVRFWEKDRETGSESPYYFRGVLKRPTPYTAAIHGLALSIMKSLEELRQTEVEENGDGNGRLPDGFERSPQREDFAVHRGQETPGSVEPAEQPGQRTVYLAKPASDLLEPYETLVRELRRRHYTVVPDPQSPLPDEGGAVQHVVRSSLAQAELSIHFIGERHGYKPDGLDIGIVSLQLAEAASEAARRPEFRRLIWTPKVMIGTEGTADSDAAKVVRDPLQILAEFDTLLETDEIDGDTAARFNEFVIQRLEASTPARPEEGHRAVTVYLTAAPDDLKLAVEAGKRLKEHGQKVLIFPTDTDYQLARRADHVAFCWGKADEITVMEALDQLDSSEWRRLRPSGQLQLIVFEPDSDIKRIARELTSFGAADLVIDAATLAESGVTSGLPPDAAG
jgi:hypothetical protein